MSRPDEQLPDDSAQRTHRSHDEASADRDAAQAELRSSPLQPALAGVVTALVGFTSSSAVVIAGLRAVGATDAQAGSGLVALCLVQGLGILWLAVRHRTPITLAWSTPGAALLAGSAGLPGGWPAAIGAFIAVGLLIVLTGLWGGLARLISRIPPALAQAMLAGVLLPLCLQPVNSLITQPLAVLPVIVVWLVLLRLAPKWAVPVAFVVGLVIMAIDPVLAGRDLEQVWPTMEVVAPQFSLAALVGIAVPLYLVTMASQNVPGVAVMRAHGYEVPWRETMLATGVGTVLAAPAGGHAVNLAAISAALAAGPDAGPRRDRRWIAAVACGASYLVLAATATALTSLIAIAPPGLIEAVAGLALLGAFGGALRAALGDAGWQTPAVITVLVAASGVTLLGIGAAFWALVAGLLVAGVLRLGRAGVASS